MTARRLVALGRPAHGRWEGVSDESLLADYVAGRHREAAFAELVDRFERRLYSICYRYFGNHSDAEEATQETFIALARRAETFAGDSKLSTWLYRVAVNACHDLARRRSRRPENPVADLTTLAGSVAPQGVAESAADLERALLHLDDTSRMLLILVGIEGLSYAEAAETTGLAVGTVKSRVHRARARLADLLAAAPAASPDGAARGRMEPRRTLQPPTQDSDHRGAT